ncbi:MAG: phosphonate metabolism transcriptional regulator PhnF [Candidatus Thiodiazotropha sp.]|nr:phosphonate metabolism transcriptional regulator PhnF [Candidatus Thiodiazotropha taylori]MBT3059473.1 phosphonate metabolism transcriptional regulator PhnF [Candidatus Thiodiazotropha sp. (ex Lucina pensylvanica)]PUB74822.1 MAG: phosphonate metabolism transcriptional regulator PhnF [gamma proteobacterium symbiont of Ctena orbiculata]PUB76892.1 MAG: phosphonate metabolism transcriptional regulator PhnF [gamma proteobacterium symbiont of Ctena orbiculata]
MSVRHIQRGDGSLPVYRQISQMLRQEIQNFYEAGDVLPTEADLAQRFNVNRHTLRRAVDELVAEGLVVRRHGKGVYVLAPAIDYAINPQTRFTETLEALGVTTHSRVIRKQVVLASGGVAARLKLAEGCEVIFLETLREVEGRPFCVISHFLPLTACPQVLESYHGGSLHAFLQKYCATRLQRSESLISAVLPESDDASLLNVPRHMPVLRVKSVNVAIDSQKPVEYVVTRFRGDATQLSVKP